MSNFTGFKGYYTGSGATILRRIGEGFRNGIGGLMAAGKLAKGSSGSKTAAKTRAKAGGPTAKSSKSTPKSAVKPSAKASKPAAKAAKSSAKAASPKVPAKVATSKVTRAAGKPDPGAAKAGSAVKAASAKSAGPKAAIKAPEKAAGAVKGSKSAEKKKTSATKDEERVSEADFAGAEEFAADIAADMEAADTEVAQAEPLTPSAALLAVMKPTLSDEKIAAAEKKKKKDDLKLDRAGDLEAQWQTLKDKNKAIKPVSYKMSESFESRIPILHKVLGWGFIISNQNDRLEVLFQQGIKFLISNYKA